MDSVCIWKDCWLGKGGNQGTSWGFSLSIYNGAIFWDGVHLMRSMSGEEIKSCFLFSSGNQREGLPGHLNGNSQLYLVRGSCLRHEQVTDSEAEHPCPSFLTKPGARNGISGHIFHQLFLWSVGPLGDTKYPGRHGSALTAHFGLRRKPKGFGFV